MRRRFTIIELLIALAILGIIGVIIFVTIDPVGNRQQSRDMRRSADINNILAAIKLYQVQKSAVIPEISTLTIDTYYQIGTCTSDGNVGCAKKTTDAGCVTLNSILTAGFLSSMPLAPKGGTAEKTGYYLAKTSTGRIYIGACNPEKTNSLELSK